ncbi:MAG: CYTH domain-containing protein [Clostridiales bacterium]|nr:CYTH domain-containing protein [Clostridiales bacterium]
MSNIETELKYLLSKESFLSLYHYIMQQAIKPSLTRQVNYYFATPDSPLEISPINIRIRLKGEKSEITYKIPISDITTDTIQSSYEYNKSISLKEAFHYIENGLSANAMSEIFSDMLKKHNFQPIDLICYGHLRTARFSFIINSDLPPLLLDVNAYLGIFDYELEWELEQVQEADSILKSMFQKLNISPIGELKAKRRRFFEQLTSLECYLSN